MYMYSYKSYVFYRMKREGEIHASRSMYIHVKGDKGQLHTRLLGRVGTLPYSEDGSH